ncbi:hypothetical protein MKEN_01213500 [Mycena kentingensis (nom. inval.)]|nr:hypothetical protein MKEN_01213500 [Mycena kentingensis (nom. inval.)]
MQPLQAHFIHLRELIDHVGALPLMYTADIHLQQFLPLRFSLFLIITIILSSLLGPTYLMHAAFQNSPIYSFSVFGAKLLLFACITASHTIFRPTYTLEQVIAIQFYLLFAVFCLPFVLFLTANIPTGILMKLFSLGSTWLFDIWGFVWAVHRQGNEPEVEGETNIYKRQKRLRAVV